MRLVLKNTLMASCSEVESVAGVGKIYDQSRLEGTQLNLGQSDK